MRIIIIIKILSNKNNMFELPKLPYAMDALAPHISSETLEFHYGKHHQTYVNNLNGLVEGTEFADMSLEEIVKNSSGWMFNNAAQIYNHTFYWNSLAPQAGGTPTGKVLSALEDAFENFENFKTIFSKSATTNFGSGWTWLVQNPDGNFDIINTDDADTVITWDTIPLMVIDVWEHAYYIDYRNARPKYIENFWNLVNWEFVEKNMK